MKTKELKNLAKKIAEQEKILASTTDPVEKEKAQDTIERLINNTHFDSYAEMDIVWDMIANLLA